MKQNIVVDNLCVSTLLDRGVEYVMNGEVLMKDALTDKDKETIREKLVIGFMNEEIDMKPESKKKFLNDMKELKKYVSGLLNNNLRKTKAFNRGEKYIIQNPGSRANSNDAQLTALKQLSIENANDSEAMESITEAIVKRKAEIESEKAVKAKPINVSVLPEHLRGLVKTVEE